MRSEESKIEGLNAKLVSIVIWFPVNVARWVIMTWFHTHIPSIEYTIHHLFNNRLKKVCKCLRRRLKEIAIFLVARPLIAPQHICISKIVFRLWCICSYRNAEFPSIESFSWTLTDCSPHLNLQQSNNYAFFISFCGFSWSLNCLIFNYFRSIPVSLFIFFWM